MVVAADDESEADEEQGQWEVPKTSGEDTRVVVVHQIPSPRGSVPVTPGRDIRISLEDDVSVGLGEGGRDQPQ